MINKSIYQKVILSLLCCAVWQVSICQKYSNEFLSIGVGARAQGMGNAFIASVDDVTAGYWNPAGLASFGASEGMQLNSLS